MFEDEIVMRTLSLLMEETPNHPKVEFKASITVKFSCKSHRPAISISTSLQMIKELYLNLATKIKLAELNRRNR